MLPLITVKKERAGLDEWVQAGGARNSSRSSLKNSLSLLSISSSLLQGPDANRVVGEHGDGLLQRRIWVG